jgi:hypothetical protein
MSIYSEDLAPQLLGDAGAAIYGMMHAQMIADHPDAESGLPHVQSASSLSAAVGYACLRGASMQAVYKAALDRLENSDASTFQNIGAEIAAQALQGRAGRADSVTDEASACSPSFAAWGVDFDYKQLSAPPGHLALVLGLAQFEASAGLKTLAGGVSQANRRALAAYAAMLLWEPGVGLLAHDRFGTDMAGAASFVYSISQARGVEFKRAAAAIHGGRH